MQTVRWVEQKWAAAPGCARGSKGHGGLTGAPSIKLTWLALGDDHAAPSRGGEQATALGRL